MPNKHPIDERVRQAKSAATTSNLRRLGVIDLFAGIGCVAQGFERAGGFETLLLTDICQDAYETYIHNFPKGPRYLCKDIAELRPKDIRKIADGRVIGGVLGCPPCQGFSSAGQRDEEDERNRLLSHYFRLVKALNPPFLLMENVPRVFEYDLFKKLLAQTSKHYQIWTGVLNAALFGAPQTRQRAIVIGYRNDLGITPTAPQPTHLGRASVYDYTSKRFIRPTTSDGARLLGLYPEVGKADGYWSACLRQIVESNTSLENLVVVQDAIGDLPCASDEAKPLQYPEARSAYAKRHRDAEVQNHVRWKHRPEMLKRLETVPEGGGLLDGDGRTRERPYFSQAYTRLHRRGLARTITTNFHNPGSGRFLHYQELRTLTVREAARLQGIHDSFVFIKNQTAQERLVGNGFPLPLAEALARHIGRELEPVTL